MLPHALNEHSDLAYAWVDEDNQMNTFKLLIPLFLLVSIFRNLIFLAIEDSFGDLELSSSNEYSQIFKIHNLGKFLLLQILSFLKSKSRFGYPIER